MDRRLAQAVWADLWGINAGPSAGKKYSSMPKEQEAVKEVQEPTAATSSRLEWKCNSPLNIDEATCGEMEKAFCGSDSSDLEAHR